MVDITGATRLHVIVGDPIAQAKSPAVYNALLAASGTDAVLVPWQLAADDFEAGMRGLLRTQNLDGIVVTYPHKQAALAFADRIRPRARQVGACNALRRAVDGRWEADMFDGVGLVAALEATGATVRDSDAWLVGAGGAGSAIAFALAAAGARSLHVEDIDGAKAAHVVAAVGAASPRTQVVAGPPDPAAMAILVHATPVGLADGDPVPASGVERLPSSAVVADIVPRDTALLSLARTRGCRTADGAAMVAGQARAVLAFFAGAP